MKIVRLGFTPLKGTRHLALPEALLDAEGAVGDRRLCLVDEGGGVVRTVQNPTLPAVVARLEDAELTLTLPSGETVRAVPEPTGESLTGDYWGRPVRLDLLAGPHAALLADHLGRPVRLAAAPRGGVIYGDRVSVVSTATLRALAEAAGVADLDPGRLRATVVVDAGDEPFAEDGWCGREVALGEARIRVNAPIARCAVIDLDPAHGGRDLPLLRTLGELRPAGTPGALCCGVDASVVEPGRIAVGDAVAPA